MYTIIEDMRLSRYLHDSDWFLKYQLSTELIAYVCSGVLRSAFANESNISINNSRVEISKYLIVCLILPDLSLKQIRPI